MYSHKGGSELVEQTFPRLFSEIKRAIESAAVSPRPALRNDKKQPSEKPYASSTVACAIRASINEQNGWQPITVECPQSTRPERKHAQSSGVKNVKRPIGYAKQRLGVDFQFTQHAPDVCNVCAKMTIFHKLGFIDCGVEIVPVKSFADEMSTGVSYFEQFVWDLEHRGVADIDIPVLILGIDG
jgi:hypothetical protein